jgi:hypothetical protein
LYSSVQNTSGGQKTFGFLPPHGQSLAPNEEFTVFGDIRQAMYRFERTEGRRNVIAFEAAIQRGDITIINTPGIFVYDVARADTKVLDLSNGVLGSINPCWDSSVSDPLIG